MSEDAAGWTLSAQTLGDVTFAERVAAAAQAGFSAIGLSTEQYQAGIERGESDAQLADLLAKHDLRLSEVEFLSTWAPEPDAAGRAKEEVAFHVARTFGADRVNAGLFEALPIEVMSAGFAALCRRAGDLRIALEFMPFGGIPDLRTAWHLVGDAAAHNGGLLIDVWHWIRAGTTAADLDAVPKDAICSLQLADVGPAPFEHQRYESLHHRVVPGRGSGRVVDILRMLAGRGIVVPVSAEVMSDALLVAGPVHTAEAVFAGMSAVVAESGYCSAGVSREP